MNRPTTLLLIAAAAIAAASVLLLTRRGTSPPAPERSEGATPGSISNPSVAPLAAAPRRSAAPITTAWHVVVIDEAGQSIKDAQLAATRPATARLDAVGDVTWDAVDAGTWTLSVQATGRPLWRNEVLVEEGVTTTTRVQIGKGVLLDGRVRDTAGRLCPGRIVGFVPNGARAPESPSRWLELPHTRTREDGRFRMLLPDAGDWRLFVGWGGEVAFEDGRPAALSPGGPSFVEVTVPSPTRLTAIVSDPPNMPRLAAHGFSVYRRADRLAADRPAQRPRASGPESPIQADESEESAAERAAEQAAAQTQTDPEQRALRMAVVPEGYAKAKSGICNAEGRITFERLPLGEELRFAVSRGTEAFAVDGQVILSPGAEVVVRLSLPEAEPPGTPQRSAPRRVLAAVEYPVGDAPAVTGAVWR